jgi:hypothetical protein
MTHQLVQQSYLMSSLDYFYISAWLSLALIPLCFIVRRPKVSEDMAVGAE